MRPRHKAAENRHHDRLARALTLVASMRPRHKAAENLRKELQEAAFNQASMRPRHKAAENERIVWSSPASDGGLQ